MNNSYFSNHSSVGIQDAYNHIVTCLISWAGFHCGDNSHDRKHSPPCTTTVHENIPLPVSRGAGTYRTSCVMTGGHACLPGWHYWPCQQLYRCYFTGCGSVWA